MSRPGTVLLRQPALSADHLAFVHAGDLWLADHSGHNVRRLTATSGSQADPVLLAGRTPAGLQRAAMTARPACTSSPSGAARPGA